MNIEINRQSSGNPVRNAEELVQLLKALADGNRLTIVGLLAGQPYTVEQLAALLKLGASTVSHHLTRLQEVGLVSARAEGYYSVYQLEAGPLDRLTGLLGDRDSLRGLAARVDLDAYDRQVVSNYLQPDGRLKALPSQRKKLLAVLRAISRSFEPGKRYPEKEVNQILRTFHEDTAYLRRELVGSGLMERAGGGGDYWLKEN